MIAFPRSTYYYRSTSQALGLTDEDLVELISGIQDELPSYGYRRVTHELRRRDHAVNHKRVARVMAEHGLGIKRRRRFVRTTDSDHDGPIFPNLYRNVIPAKLDLVWVADITLYLVVVANSFRYPRRGQHGYHVRLRAWDVDVAPRLTFAPFRDRTVAKASPGAMSLH